MTSVTQEQLDALKTELETLVAANQADTDTAMTHTWLILCGAMVMSAGRRGCSEAIGSFEGVALDASRFSSLRLSASAPGEDSQLDSAGASPWQCTVFPAQGSRLMHVLLPSNGEVPIRRL